MRCGKIIESFLIEQFSLYEKTLKQHEGEKYMRGFSIWHWVMLIVFAGLTILPFWKITKKAGFSGWWSLWIFVPMANVVWLYVLAFSRWPSAKE